MRWALITALLLAATHALATDFLRREELRFVPSEGNSIITAKLLDPSKRYRIMIEAEQGHTLAPLLTCLPRVIYRGLFGYTKEKIFCTAKLLFDGEELPPYEEHTDNTWGFLLYDFDPHRYYIPQVQVFLYGTGRPLGISIQDDLSYNIPRVRLVIEDIEYLEALKVQERLRDEELIRLEAERLRREAQVQERIREEKAAIRRGVYLETLKFIFLLAVLTVVIGFFVWLALTSRNNRTTELKRLTGVKVTTKRPFVRGLSAKTRS